MFDDKIQVSEYFSDKAIRDHKIDESQFSKNWNASTIPVQTVGDKLAKNNLIPVMSMAIDYENERFVYKAVKNKSESIIVTLPFTAAAQYYGWKSWKLNEFKTEFIFEKDVEQN